MVPKVGRNDRCPCGSGKKYKRCHADEPPVLDFSKAAPSDPCPCRSGQTFAACHLPEVAKIQRVATEMRAKQEAHRARFGEMSPTVHGEYKYWKFVTVGSTAFFEPKHRLQTPVDFLIRYMPTVFNREWGQREVKKVFVERHPILQFYDALCRCQARFPRREDGLIEFVPDGPTMAYLLLAFDLYAVKADANLQSKLLRRLRTPAKFQAARHELFTAAVAVRAGFEIEYEDDRLPGRHAEFIGTHQRTGLRVAFEAKSRHRPGVLGYRGNYTPAEKVDVQTLLQKAFAKGEKIDLPLVILVDVNLPPSAGDRWKLEIQQVVERMRTERTKDPYNLLIFSNIPLHYGAEGEKPPMKQLVSFQAHRPRIPVTDRSLLARVAVEASKWGLLPDTFEH